MTTINATGNGLTGASGSGSFVGSTSPTITTPQINTSIKGSLGNNIIGLNDNSSATSYLNIDNGIGSIALSVGGSDTNANLGLTSKGSGFAIIISPSSTTGARIIAGSASHVTDFVFANTSASRTVTFPDTNGTVTLLGNSSTGSGNVVLATSPTITTPQIAQINDTNGNALLGLTTTASSVNNLTITNNATGSAPLISVAGTDTNIGIVQSTKGTGQYLYYSTATSYQVLFSMGAGGANLSSFTFNSTNTTYPGRNYSFPDASGTVTLLGNSSTGSGNVVLATSPTITTPVIGQINDSIGNIVLKLDSTASAVNYVDIGSAVTGGAPIVGAAGTDTNINLILAGKGTGYTQLYTTGNAGIQFLTGTGYQHNTLVNFANTSAVRTVSFPDASGTLQLQTQAVISAPGNSASSSLAVGTNFQNTTGNDIVLTVYLAVSAATSASILVGVGSASSPTQQTVVSGLTLAALGIIPIPIYIPNNYYALVSTSGTITQTISGQMAMPV